MKLEEIDGYYLAPIAPETQAVFADRFRDPATWKPFNWFGFEYGGTPNGAMPGGSFGDSGALAVVNKSQTAVGLVQWVPGFWYGGANRHRAWNFGLVVLPEYRRTRATRAGVMLIIDYLFTHTNVHRIEATTDSEGFKRDSGFESTGLRREGIMRNAQWREGKWRDMTLLAILREDWEQNRLLGSKDEQLDAL